MVKFSLPKLVSSANVMEERLDSLEKALPDAHLGFQRVFRENLTRSSFIRLMILVFDFDGVVVDSLPDNVRILNERFSWLLKHPLTVQMVREKGLKEVLKEYRVKGWKLALAVWYARRAIRKE